MKKLSNEELNKICAMSDREELIAKLESAGVVMNLTFHGTLKVADELERLGYTNRELNKAKLHHRKSDGVLNGGGYYRHAQEMVERHGEGFGYLNAEKRVRGQGKTLNTALKMRYLLMKTKQKQKTPNEHHA